MSITGISAASSAAQIQQLQNATPSSAVAQAMAAQTASTPQIGSGPQQASAQPPGQVHHHHHRHSDTGSAAPEADELTQSNTTPGTRTNILNTLV